MFNMNNMNMQNNMNNMSMQNNMNNMIMQNNMNMMNMNMQNNINMNNMSMQNNMNNINMNGNYNLYLQNMMKNNNINMMNNMNNINMNGNYNPLNQNMMKNNNMNMMNNNINPNMMQLNMFNMKSHKPFNMMNMNMNLNNNMRNNMMINMMPPPKINAHPNYNKKSNQIVGIESVIPINVISKDIINDQQYDIITQVCVEAIKQDKRNIALYCTEKIMSKLKGQWFVLINDINEKNYEFSFSKISFKNILLFQYRNKIVYVSPLKYKK